MPISNTSSSNTIKFVFDDGIAIPYIVRFWIFLVSDILSLICCLFVLYHFLFDSNLRRGLHNHVIIIILFMCLIWELTTVPWSMYLFLYDVVWIQTPTFLVYGITTPMNNCNRPFYYFIPMCAYSSCVYNSVVFSLYEYVTGGLLCSVLIGFGSTFLVLRVIIRKRHLQQQIQWRKHRKMILQLLSVSSLFIVLYLPPVILATAYKLGVPTSVGAQYITYGRFLSYYIVFLFPFTCLSTIPELGTRIKNIFRCRWRQQANTVLPQQRTARITV
ncbi:unnamed protein product, partial [Adineta steineri]